MLQWRESGLLLIAATIVGCVGPTAESYDVKLNGPNGAPRVTIHFSDNSKDECDMYFAGTSKAMVAGGVRQITRVDQGDNVPIFEVKWNGNSVRARSN